MSKHSTDGSVVITEGGEELLDMFGQPMVPGPEFETPEGEIAFLKEQRAELAYQLTMERRMHEITEGHRAIAERALDRTLDRMRSPYAGLRASEWVLALCGGAVLGILATLGLLATWN